MKSTDEQLETIKKTEFGIRLMNIIVVITLFLLFTDIFQIVQGDAKLNLFTLIFTIPLILFTALFYRHIMIKDNEARKDNLNNG